MKKSRFLTFIFSFIPGCAQYYLGYGARGTILFALAILIGFLGLFSVIIGHSLELGLFFLACMAILWFIGMFDSMILFDRVRVRNRNIEYEEVSKPIDEGEDKGMKTQNKKLTAMILSMVPGAGHLYLGLQRQGIEIMTTFFVLIYLTDWLSFGGFMMFVPILWFYNVFDIMHKVSGTKELHDDSIFEIFQSVFGSSFMNNRSKILGYGLILIGVMLIFNRVIVRFLNMINLGYAYYDIIKTSFVALLFIAGGVKLVAGNKKSLETLESQEEV